MSIQVIADPFCFPNVCSRDKYDRVVDALFNLPMPDVGLPADEPVAGTPSAAQVSFPLS